MTVLFKHQAIADLRGIHSYIAERNPLAAVRMARRLVGACDRLELFPGRGRRGDELGT
jgi:plasmid stabilization system protein ParE